MRYLAQDDARQSARVTRLIERELDEKNPGFISLIVLVETCWVLKQLYGATPSELRDTISDLLGTRQLRVERRGVVTRALARLPKAGATMTSDIADALTTEISTDAGCEQTMTFDKGTVSLGMTLLR